jgi:hypothetical protein
MRWVTRAHVHVDRTACPWLIERFIDPEAEFLFLPLEKIPDIVKNKNAIPYDCPDVELGHHGEKCSFDAIVKRYKVTDPAVLELAKIVRAADTDRYDLAPEAAGLEAIMSGIAYSSKSDKVAVKTAKKVYDAFYVHCKLKLLYQKHKVELSKMDKNKKRAFLKEKLNLVH